MKLIAAGYNDCKVARTLGIPRSTIRDWRRPIYVPRNGRLRASETCPRCWRAGRSMRFTPEDYAELLGLYLGDGHIAVHPRTQRLRIILDKKYRQIIDDACALLKRCFPGNKVDVVPAPGCVHVSVYSIHLACLFPQHGRGPKHLRPIALEPWQWESIEAAPWSFIRGCIRSDGCAFINRTGPYEYLSYEFANSSGDIVDLFVAACNLVGVEYRRTKWSARNIWRVRINRRRSVGLMLKHVGRKA